MVVTRENDGEVGRVIYIVIVKVLKLFPQDIMELLKDS